MTFVLNGDDRELSESVTVASLVEQLGRGKRGTAVALNGEVVPRSVWDDTTISEGDRVEVLTAVGGG
jgi:sulfur carrier protein